MNEQILELAEQTKEFMDGSDDLDIFVEKFAELIVKKCAMIGNYAYDGGEYPGPMIKEYFGVE